MKSGNKNNCIETIETGSALDLLLTAIFNNTFFVCEQYSGQKQNLDELHREGDWPCGIAATAAFAFESRRKPQKAAMRSRSGK